MKEIHSNKEIYSVEQAVEILSDQLEDQLLREQAIRFLSYHPSEEVINKLVWTLQDDEFGIRWEAAVTLAQLGEKALPELLKEMQVIYGSR